MMEVEVEDMAHAAVRWLCAHWTAAAGTACTGLACALLDTQRPARHHRDAHPGLLLGASIAALILPLWTAHLAALSLLSLHMIHGAWCPPNPILKVSAAAIALSAVAWSLDTTWTSTLCVGDASGAALAATLPLVLLHLFPASFTHCEAWLTTQGLLCAAAVAASPVMAIAPYVTLLPLPLSFTVEQRLVAICVLGALLVTACGRVFMALVPRRHSTATTPIATTTIAALAGVALSGFGFVIPMLSHTLQQNTFVWLWSFMCINVFPLAYCACVCATGIGAIAIAPLHSSLHLRKAYHFLALVLFVPLLLFAREFLFISLSFAFVVFVLGEFVRACALEPFAAPLERLTRRYWDGQDSGAILLTPIYLLTGIAIPIWSTPSPPSSLPWLRVPIAACAGLLAVGVGDSAAAVIGRR
ncbi:hypothetical protein PTSG_09670 [Salpingoeca rosetta]|uniref:dolichol kinase n=1 Tax=Salpingoeca rosetta (strain ATCC 50818 / BSB-021) TaxID=946362 RepID=F2ULN4_SALR5|nr:uncharacterized protein PTSG_09670 [Salpingoeca rosetta]EGD78033.1 hypothetical protein PTSG_09670 [Salpingoeca rosetta]|eukprot:XP_004990095.1 hypothetical protein PTSG_09670 [Salpingoeca rosetta]